MSEERDEKKTVRGEPRNQRERRGRARERTRACLDVPPFRARVSLYLCFAHSRTRRHWNKSGDASKDSREKILSVFVAFFQFIFGKKNSKKKRQQSRRGTSRETNFRVPHKKCEREREREKEKEKERKMRPPPSWPSWKKKKKKKIVERTRDDVEKEQQKKVFHGIKCLKKQLKKALNFEVGKLKRRINTIESSASGNKNTTEKTKEITTEKQLVAAKTISVEDLEVLAKMLADACFKQIVSKKEEKGKGKFLLSSGDDEKKKKKKKEEEKEVIEAKELVARRVVHAKCVNEEMESLKARILLVQTRATQIEEARKRSEERLEKKKKKKEDAAKRRAQEEEDKKTKKNGDRNSFDIKKKKKKKKRSESVSSGSESDDEEEEEEQQQLSSAGEESDDSISLSEETRQAMREAREGAMQKKKKRKKIIDVDDDDNDDPLKSAPLSPPKKKQKARMGQRQRRLLAEQQYGKNAKHVIAEQQKAEEERRKAEEELRTMHPSWKAKRMDAKKPMIIPLNGKGKGKKVVFDHDGGDRKNLAAKVKVNDDKPLHPSWSAKLKQDQEAWSGGAVAFQGKKKTFE